MGHGEVVTVENATASILGSVYQNDDVFIGSACQPVVEFLQMEGGQIAVAIESVEVGAEGCVAPKAFRGLAGAAFLRRCLYGHHTETAALALEGFVFEEGFVGNAGVFFKLFHLIGTVAFGQIGYMNAASGIGRMLYIYIRCNRTFADVFYQNVLGVDLMGERGHHFAAVVAQVDGDVNSLTGHRHEKNILERLRGGLGFIIGEPFLKQRGEGVAVEDAA